MDMIVSFFLDVLLLPLTPSEIRLYVGILATFAVCFLVTLLWPFGGDQVVVFGWCASIAIIGAACICLYLAVVDYRRNDA